MNTSLEPMVREIHEVHEISLDDTYSESILSEPMPMIQPAVFQSDNKYQLPATLCDQELVEELNKIPDQMGFKIGDVADLVGIKQYVLRYWETEFDVLRPKKATNNQRYYTRKDVENVFLIRKLLHRDRFSIEGARAVMKDLRVQVRKEKDWSQVNTRIDFLQDKIDDLLIELRKMKTMFA